MGLFIGRNRCAHCEQLEPRNLMSTVTSYTDNYYNNLNSATYFAEFQLGNNGDPGGVAGAIAGMGPDVENSMLVKWDTDLTDGLDSGLVDFQYTVDLASSSNSLSLDGTAVGCSSSSTSSLHNVTLRAGVMYGGLASSLQGVLVQFYSGNTLVDSAYVANDSADMLNSSSGDPFESITTVATSATNVDKVVVTGAVRLQSTTSVSPDPGDIFSGIYIS